MKHSLEIAISTYNRAHILEAWIENNFKQLSQLGIKLSIYDSSTNDDTLNLVNAFNSKENSMRIKYVRKDSSIRVDEKVMLSIIESSADYIWPLGDATSINFNDVSSKVIPFLDKDYDFVCVFGCTRLDNDRKTYSSPLEFFGDCFWHATWLGGIIFERSIFDPLLKKEEYDRLLRKYDRNDGFSYLGIFYELIANKQIQAAFTVIGTDGTIGKKKVQGWLKRYMEVWCDNLIYVVDSLPDYYNSQKDKVLKETWEILDLDSVWSYRARKCGALSKDIYEHYDRMGYLDRVLEDKRRIRKFSTLPMVLIKPYYLINKVKNKLMR